MAVFKYNSCIAGVIKEVDEDTEEEYLVLHNIESKCMGNGDGTLVLEDCKRFARIMRMELRCHPWALYGDHERLKRWYLRHGFIDTGDWFVYYGD